LKFPRALILSVLSGILFSFTWNGFLPVISLCFAFVPLMVLFNEKNLSSYRVFNYSFLAMMMYHAGTVWWLYKSSFPGFLAIISLNSIYFSIALVLAHRVRLALGVVAGWAGLIGFWLAFEYIHYDWELSWPFMNLGNWPGQIHIWIQWYEYTGIAGGSLLILLLNLMVYYSLDSLIKKKWRVFTLSVLAILISVSVPAFISHKLYNTQFDSGPGLNFKIIQPDIDPYIEKYDSDLFDSQIEKQIKLASFDSAIIPDIYLYPESSFPVYLREDSITHSLFMKELANNLLIDKSAMIVGGMYSFDLSQGDSMFYNTAFLLSKPNHIQLRHKSRLVPGVEKMPFQNYFGILKKLNLDFGGFTASLESDAEAVNFISCSGTFSVAPVICYESVYGNYVSEFVRKGATFIAVITNDAWWGDTPGYYQHLMHSRLRAIENRRNIIRAANTGISCHINSKGDIVSQLPPYTETVLSGEAFQNNALSFYTRNGDFIGKFSCAFSVLTIILLVFMAIKGKSKLQAP
jgi:apolipoprotein N-acyltransferase